MHSLPLISLNQTDSLTKKTGDWGNKNKNPINNKVVWSREMLKKLITLSAASAAIVLSGMSHAATATGTLSANASVPSVCNIAGVTDITFGSYDPTSATPTDANGDVGVRCTKGTAYEVFISTVRTMTDGTDTLNFELYNDVSGGTVWGDVVGHAGNVSNTPASNAPTTHTIYGRIPALQDVGAGNYAGSVTITVNY